MWIDPSLSYKFVLMNSNDVVQWTVDQASAGGASGLPEWGATTNYEQGSVIQDSGGEGMLYVSLQSNNVNHALSDVAYWRVFSGKVRTITTNTTLAITDDLVRSNSTSGNLTHTLPPCSTTPIGKKITIKDVGTGGYATTIKGSGSDLVDKTNVYSSPLMKYNSLVVVNSGSIWDVVSVSLYRTPIVFDVFGVPRVQDGILFHRVDAAITLNTFRVIVNDAGTSGTLTVDMEYKRGAGAWTSILSSPVSIASSSGDLAAAVGTLSVTSLDAGDFLRLNVDATQASIESFSVIVEN